MKQKTVESFIRKPQRALLSRIREVEQREAFTRDEVLKKAKLLTRLYAKKEEHEVR